MKLFKNILDKISSKKPGSKQMVFDHVFGTPEVAPHGLEVKTTVRYASPKMRDAVRRTHNANFIKRQLERNATRKATELLRQAGNPPFYGYSHRDALVAKFGSRIANRLEDGIMRGNVFYADALARDKWDL